MVLRSFQVDGKVDGSPEEIFKLTDEMASMVAGRIESGVENAEIRRSIISRSRNRTRDWTAYDLYLHALPHWGSYEKPRLLEALDLLEGAAERDPRFALAPALAAHCHHMLALNDLTNASMRHLRMSVDLGRLALQLSDDDSDVLANCAFVLGYSGDLNIAIELIDRSLYLNPSSARAWVWSAALRNFIGRPDLAIEHFEKSWRLNPRHRLGAYSVPLAIAHFFNRNFDVAYKILDLSVKQAPSFTLAHRLLASCCAHMKRNDEARERIVQLKTITPIVIPSLIPYRHPEHRELFLSGLRQAAGEDMNITTRPTPDEKSLGISVE